MLPLVVQKVHNDLHFHKNRVKASTEGKTEKSHQNVIRVGGFPTT